MKYSKTNAPCAENIRRRVRQDGAGDDNVKNDNDWLMGKMWQDNNRGLTIAVLASICAVYELTICD